MIWPFVFLAIVIVPGVTSFFSYVLLGKKAGVSAVILWVIAAVVWAAPLGSFILPRYLAAACGADIDGDCLEIMFAPLLYFIVLGLMGLGLVVVSLFVFFGNPHRQILPSRS